MAVAVAVCGSTHACVCVLVLLAQVLFLDVTQPAPLLLSSLPLLFRALHLMWQLQAKC